MGSGMYMTISSSDIIFQHILSVRTYAYIIVILDYVK